MHNTNEEIKSLKKQVKDAPNDSFKVKSLLEIARYYLNDNIEKSRLYAERAMKTTLLLDNADDEKEKNLADVWRYLGTIYTFVPDYTKALKFNKLALDYFSKTDDEHKIARILSSIGNIYIYLYDQDMALEYHEKALEAYRRLDSKNDIISTMNNVSAIHGQIGHKNLAISYAKEGIKIAKEIGHENHLASLYLTLAHEYQYTGHQQKALKLYMDAYEIIKRHKKIHSLAVVTQNIGTLYSEIGENDKAMEYLEISLEYANESEVKSYITAAKEVMGITYMNMGQFDKAEELFNETLELIKKFHLDKFATLYEDFANLYEKKKDYKKAYQYFKRYYNQKEKVFKENLNEKIANIKIKFDMEKQEQKAKFAKMESDLLKSKNNELKKINQKLEDANKEISQKQDELTDMNMKLQSLANNRKSILLNIIDDINAIIIFISATDDFIIANQFAENIAEKLFPKIPLKEKFRKLHTILISNKNSKYIEIVKYFGKTYIKIKFKNPIITDYIVSSVKTEEGEDIGELLYCKDLSEFIENQVKLEKFQKDIQRDSEILSRKNIALNEILSHIEKEKNIQKESIKKKIDMVIMPLLLRIQNSNDPSEELIRVLRNNISSLVSADGKLYETYKNLSSREIEICNMIKNGMSSKEISIDLNIEASTVDRHRSRIRKKLGISGKKINLPNYLKNNT
ncbi:MAG: tetratricopeptide repeat protein [Candidatus Zixiibacteriota bacterium]